MRKPVDYTLFREILAEVLPVARVSEMRAFTTSYGTTVYDHCLRVAFKAYTEACRRELACDLHALVRGALLLGYEFTERNALMHPRAALRTAEEDFDLNEIERNILRAQNFPLTFWAPPLCREARLVAKADRRVSARERAKCKKAP